MKETKFSLSDMEREDEHYEATKWSENPEVQNFLLCYKEKQNYSLMEMNQLTCTRQNWKIGDH